MDTPRSAQPLRFGSFELDVEAGHLLMDGRPVPLSPQPFKLLCLFASRPGELLTRDQIRVALWNGDTFVDFAQGVNFAIRQVREALKDDAERPLYIQTVPKRGYRFIAPVSTAAPSGAPGRGGTDLALHKVLWTNIAELRLAEVERESRRRLLMRVAAAVALVLLTLLWVLR